MNDEHETYRSLSQGTKNKVCPKNEVKLQPHLLFRVKQSQMLKNKVITTAHKFSQINFIYKTKFLDRTVSGCPVVQSMNIIT